jgi:hypothetical protein
MEPREQSCEACGRSFGCGALTGCCWCTQVALHAAALAALRERYERCLCPECLVAPVLAGASPTA